MLFYRILNLCRLDNTVDRSPEMMDSEFVLVACWRVQDKMSLCHACLCMLLPHPRKDRVDTVVIFPDMDETELEFCITFLYCRVVIYDAVVGESAGIVAAFMAGMHGVPYIIEEKSWDMNVGKKQPMLLSWSTFQKEKRN